jgi:hypothetical protein
VQLKGAIKRLPADKSAELSKSIRGPDPPPSPPPKDPCRPMPPPSPCGNKCAEMAIPPLSPKRPCSPPDPPTHSPPSWPASPPKSPLVLQLMFLSLLLSLLTQEVIILCIHDGWGAVQVGVCGVQAHAHQGPVGPVWHLHYQAGGGHAGALCGQKQGQVRQRLCPPQILLLTLLLFRYHKTWIFFQLSNLYPLPTFETPFPRNSGLTFLNFTHMSVLDIRSWLFIVEL